MSGIDWPLAVILIGLPALYIAFWVLLIGIAVCAAVAL